MNTHPKTSAWAGALALSLGTAITVAAAGVDGKEIILHEAINDYSDSSGSFKDPAPLYRGNAYRMRIILDEAQLDYNDADIAAYAQDLSTSEETEFAAFEETSPFDVPWELRVVD